MMRESVHVLSVHAFLGSKTNVGTVDYDKMTFISLPTTITTQSVSSTSIVCKMHKCTTCIPTLNHSLTHSRSNKQMKKWKIEILVFHGLFKMFSTKRKSPTLKLNVCHFIVLAYRFDINLSIRTFLYNFQLTINLPNTPPPAFLPDCQSVVSCDTDIMRLWSYQVHCHFSSLMYASSQRAANPFKLFYFSLSLPPSPPYSHQLFQTVRSVVVPFFSFSCSSKTVNENENEPSQDIGKLMNFEFVRVSAVLAMQRMNGRGRRCAHVYSLARLRAHPTNHN